MRWLGFGVEPPSPGVFAPLPRTAAEAAGAVEAALDTLGGLEGVVVRLEAPDEDAELGAAVDASLRPLLHAARAALWDLCGAEGAHVAVIGPPPGPGPARASAAAGARALCRSIAKEYGRAGVRCNRIEAGPDALEARVLDAVRFLADARYVTGETLKLSEIP